MTGEKIGEVIATRLDLGYPPKRGATGEKLITMYTRQSLDAELLQHRIELAASTAIAVGDENVLEQAVVFFCSSASAILWRVVKALSQRLYCECKSTLGHRCIYVKSENLTYWF